jgi:hypothetical protein
MVGGNIVTKDLISEFSNERNSFYFNDIDNDLKHVGFFSLRTAIESYLSTYKAMKNELVIEKIYAIKKANLDTIRHSHDYCVLCFKTIIHFQHCFELFIKQILEDEHPLLVVRANTKPVIFHKLLKKDKISEEEYESLFSVEFSDALNTINELIKNKRLDDSYTFIREHSNILKSLNGFRNRMWHKGMFLLRYHALDEFICRYILPLLSLFLELPIFTGYEKVWKYQTGNELNLDIITELINEFDELKGKSDLSKVALLKEIGRIQYSDYYLRNNDEVELRLAIEEGYINDIKQCPVCNEKTLLNCNKIDYDFDEIYGHGGYTLLRIPIAYESHVSCITCAFEVNKFVENLNSYGLRWENFWIGEREHTHLKNVDF